MGSSLEALCAGYSPAARPTIEQTNIPATTHPRYHHTALYQKSYPVHKQDTQDDTYYCTDEAYQN